MSMIVMRFTGSQDGDDGPFTIASGGAWNSVIAWVDAIALCPLYLNALVKNGSVQNTVALSHDLREALSKFKPGPVVRTILNEMLRCVRVGDSAETAIIGTE